MFNPFKSLANAVSRYWPFSSTKPELAQVRESMTNGAQGLTNTDTKGLTRASGVTLESLMTPVNQTGTFAVREKIQETERYLAGAQEAVRHFNEIVLDLKNSGKTEAEILKLQ